MKLKQFFTIGAVLTVLAVLVLAGVCRYVPNFNIKAQSEMRNQLAIPASDSHFDLPENLPEDVDVETYAVLKEILANTSGLRE